VVFPSGELGLALENCKVHPETDWNLLLAYNEVRDIADQAADAPYRDEYCCGVISRMFLASNLEATAAAMGALLKMSSGLKRIRLRPLDCRLKRNTSPLVLSGIPSRSRT
jgi:hypothetical protein